MAWQGIEGHDTVVERFVVAQARGRIAGTYLFLGPEGVGKATFAQALAKALVCPKPSPGLIPCGLCPSCLQADAGSHPDIDVVAKPEDRATIPLETFIGDRDNRMREGLCWRILLRPALGKRKVAIILDADFLAEEGANCLLKTLEEPPDGAVIILVGTALERQLPTIRIARARVLLDPELAPVRARFLALLAARPLQGVDLSKEVQAAVEEAGKDAPPRRARLRIILGAAIEFFRAALRQGAGDVDVPIDDPALARAVHAWGGSVEEATDALRSTLDALDAIDRNAHLPTLVDGWSARLEPPPAAPARPSLSAPISGRG